MFAFICSDTSLFSEAQYSRLCPLHLYIIVCVMFLFIPVCWVSFVGFSSRTSCDTILPEHCYAIGLQHTSTAAFLQCAFFFSFHRSWQYSSSQYFALFLSYNQDCTFVFSFMTSFLFSGSHPFSSDLAHTFQQCQCVCSRFHLHCLQHMSINVVPVACCKQENCGCRFSAKVLCCKLCKGVLWMSV